jgi:hypothetical protein
MTESTHSPRRRARVLLASVVAAGSLVGLSAAAGAQTTDPVPTTNFSMVGVADAQAGTAISVDATVSGTFGFCNNVNGLGAELYLSGGNGTNLTVRHATVSPFVVPLHLGLLGVTNTDPANPVSEDFVTIGVAQGTPVQFGSTGTATATYGGIFAGKTGAGMVSWNYSTDITCSDSLVMPILEPLLTPSTTAAPAPPG